MNKLKIKVVQYADKVSNSPTITFARGSFETREEMYKYIHQIDTAIQWMINHSRI